MSKRHITIRTGDQAPEVLWPKVKILEPSRSTRGRIMCRVTVGGVYRAGMVAEYWDVGTILHAEPADAEKMSDPDAG